MWIALLPGPLHGLLASARDSMSTTGLVIVLIPIALLALSLIVVRLIIDPKTAAKTEAVMYHVVGIGTLALTCGLLFLAYYSDNTGITIVMLVLACAPGYSAWGYLNGRGPTR
jgi:hypothetical protein